MEEKEVMEYRKAGEIAKKVKEFARSIIKPDMPLLEIAEKIEAKIVELGGKPAFPVNLCIDDIAAHYTPYEEDTNLAEGLLKVDVGVHVNGYIADTAFSMDLADNDENKMLILASQKALEEATKTMKEGIELWKIGRAIQDKIEQYKFSPVRNLSGHELNSFNVHAGTTIPNYKNNSNQPLKKGAYAVEPFVTSGEGLVYDGKPSGIYKFEKKAGIRDPVARKILEFIDQEYKTLPFCSRWIVKSFGKRAILSLHLLEQAGIIMQYPQLIEKSHSRVAQSEDTILVSDEVEVTT